MQAYAEFDVSRPPVVVVQIVSPPTDENYPLYLEQLGASFRELDRFAMIFDTGSLASFPAKYRDMQARWLKETEEEFRGRWVCSAFVIPNRMIRGVLMTLNWLNPPYYDSTVVKNREKAWAFTREKLAEAGVSLEP